MVYDDQKPTSDGLEGQDVADQTVLTANIVCAYIANNSVRPGDLAELITSVHQALGSLGKLTSPVAEVVEKLTPAQIRKSISPDGMISFLDGQRYKSMKRHLTSHGLDPRTYRDRFGLPSDYPMVSANYSAKRSAFAKSIGLGQIRKTVGSEPAALSDKSQGRRRPRSADAAE